MTPSDWDRLFDAFGTGNDQNLGDLFQKLGEYLLRAAYKCIESKPELHTDAHDCIQEALLAIWKNIVKRAGPQHRQATSSWCTQIVVHKVLDLLRKHGYSLTTTPSAEPQWGGRFVALDEDVVSPLAVTSDVDRQIDRAETMHKVFTNSRLTSDERMILWLGYMEERDDRTIADYLGIAQATVRVKRMRALQKLRDDPELRQWLD